MRCLRLGIALLVAIAIVSQARAEQRLALVIGINAYRDVPGLEKAVGDADAMAAALSALGFTVTEVKDADRRTLNQAISTFGASISPGATTFVHFSGHGVEIDGENYLLPADAPKPASGEKDFIKSESVAMSTLVARIADAGAATRIFVIDACRDNPFEQVGVRSVGATRGLARVEAPAGTFIMYSAGYRQTALDTLGVADGEKTSVYTRVLVKHLGQPGVALDDIAQDVRSEVEELARGVGHDQRPAYYDELTGRVVLSTSTVPQVAVAAVAPSTSNAPQAADPAATDYALANQIGTKAAWDAFIASHDAGSFYVALAIAARDKLAAPSETPEAPRTPPDAAPTTSTETNSAQEVAVLRPEDVEKALSLSLEQRQAVQRGLANMGYEPGSADGNFGGRTRDALKSYQAAAGLPETGYLSQEVERAIALADAHSEPAENDTLARRVDVALLPTVIDPRLRRAIEKFQRFDLKYAHHGGHLYLAVLTNGLGWEAAERLAEGAGGHLATIGSRAENQFLYDFFIQDERFVEITPDGQKNGPWIGLYQPAGSAEPRGGWRWVTEERLDYANWSRGQPNNFGGFGNFAMFHSYGAMDPRQEQQCVRWDDTNSGPPGALIEIE